MGRAVIWILTLKPNRASKLDVTCSVVALSVVDECICSSLDCPRQLDELYNLVTQMLARCLASVLFFAGRRPC